MKKLILTGLALLAGLAFTACDRGGSGDQLKIGMTVQDLSNPTWAGYCKAIQKEAEASGASMNYVACESNVSKQITQIENFVARGMKVIIVHPADPAGIEQACKQAMAAGVKIIAWDDDIKNAALR